MSRYENITIWKVEKTLEEILELIKLDYSIIDEELANCTIPIEEKLINHRWSCDYDGIQEKVIDDITIRFIFSSAIIETNKFTNSNKLKVRGIPLDKKDRILEQISKVFFVEYMGSVYVIINGAKTNESKVKIILLDQKSKKDSIWGTIYSKNVGIYNFDKMFYRWIIVKKGDTLVDGNNKIRIEDVSGFKTCGDRNSNNFSGEGSNIDNETPFKTIVSLDENISKLHIKLLVNDRESYDFSLESDGRLSITKTLCGEFAVQNPRVYEIEEIAINIYFYIIPLLSKKYNMEKVRNWQETDNKYRTECSKQIIEVLLNKHKDEGIELEEIIKDKKIKLEEIS